jgi:hypothetical protein
MQEADKEYIKNVEKQLDSFHKKKTALILWLKKHPYSHPDYDLKKRELNNVEWKIKQLIERKSIKKSYDYQDF